MNNITFIAELLTEHLQSAGIGNASTLKEIELTTKQCLETLGRTIVENLAKSQNDPKTKTIPCSCGEIATYNRARNIHMKTIYGDIQFKRNYYLCSSCKKGNSPLDAQLQITPNSISNTLAEYLAFMGVQLPYQASKQVIEKFFPISISDHTISKSTYRWGKKIEQEEQNSYELSCQSENLLKQQRDAQKPRRLYGTIDAVKAHTVENGIYQWRDVKVGAWFEAKAVPPKSPDGDWSIHAENINYYADICEAKVFGEQFWSSGYKRNANIAIELILIGDGAEWIWNLADYYYPQSIQILDWFHSSEHLKPVAIVFDKEEIKTEWIERMKGYLWEGKTEVVIKECQRLFSLYKQDICRKTANYFETHKHRMRYEYYRNQGYQIGSGTIESAAKQIGLMRMKVPGATWNIKNAPMIAKARASFLSGNRPDFSICV